MLTYICKNKHCEIPCIMSLLDDEPQEPAYCMSDGTMQIWQELELFQGEEIEEHLKQIKLLKKLL